MLLEIELTSSFEGARCSGNYKSTLRNKSQLLMSWRVCILVVFSQPSRCMGVKAIN